MDHTHKIGLFGIQTLCQNLERMNSCEKAVGDFCDVCQQILVLCEQIHRKAACEVGFEVDQRWENQLKLE